jgi:hypothetical protein
MQHGRFDFAPHHSDGFELHLRPVFTVGFHSISSTG